MLMITIENTSRCNALASENLRLKQELKQQSDVLTDWKLHEKRLMYLIYLAIENGHPIDKIYEEKVGIISTERFHKLVEWEEVVSYNRIIFW